MWLRLIKAGCQIGTIDQPVSQYRFHTAQMTRNGSQMTRASFAVLDKTYQDPALPLRWQQLRDQAYANAYVRAAAHSYLALDFEAGKANLEKAVSLHPPLALDPDALANRLAGLTDLPKTNEPLVFLENIYNHLPASLQSLQSRKHKNLGMAAANLAFEAYRLGQYPLARKRMVRAIRYQPRYLVNRGVLSVLIKSLLHA